MLQLTRASTKDLWLVSADAIDSVMPRVVGDRNETVVFLRGDDNYMVADEAPAQIARLRQAAIKHRGDLTVAYVYIYQDKVTLAG